MRNERGFMVLGAVENLVRRNFRQQPIMLVVVGRGERIRTSDLSVPNRAHYQAVLRPELIPTIGSRAF